MEFAEVLRRRRMVRRFADEAVSRAELDAVLDAARRAPTAGFTQGVSYLLLTGDDVDTFWQITAAGRTPDAWQAGMRAAPALILVWTNQGDYLERYARPDKGWTDRDPGRWSAPYWWVDAGMGALAALLTVTDQGLGACFFGVPVEHQDEVRQAYGVPADQASVGVIAIGRPAPDRRRPVRDRRPVVHRGRWGH